MYGAKGSTDLFNPSKAEVAIDPESSVGKSIRILASTFGPTALVPEYINAGTGIFDSGNSMLAVAQLILDSPQFQAIVSPENENGFINLIIGNVFGRSPTEDEVVIVTEYLRTHSKAELIVLATSYIDVNKFKNLLP